jgi:hypothetical protein
MTNSVVAVAYPLDESQPLPFAPGSGPFRIKGDTYNGHLDYVSKNVPGGVEAMLRGFKDPRLAEFFQQRFLAGSRYDIIPLVTAGYVCGRLSGTSFNEFVRVRSEYQANRDLNGLYRMLLKLTSPSAVLKRLPALLAQYLDFVGPTVETSLGPKHSRLAGGPIPLMLVPWFRAVNQVYMQVTLAAAGARNVTVRQLFDEPAGEQHGHATVLMNYEVQWS